MPPVPTHNLPKSKIPPWERRRGPQSWKWNGERRGDPRLPRLERALEARPGRLLVFAFAGMLIGAGILFLTVH
ncbi:hypothetical protein [Mesoterricola silvestris]|uniref:Uncharacterized protein n=1 Tax=Mesoterricola silvestris TaxID=2927979 RepID=A0AA48GK21_9BACT|nr:hypothetical protein [Mesoterricola silvestris]BDU74471.1 hypothetical protein METEAL_36450 [Mesoterricola silvestris]